MTAAKRRALGTKIDEAIEASNRALVRASERLVKSYYDGVEDLRQAKGVDGYIKLNVRARPRGTSVEISWFNKHTRGGAKGFESVPKQRGKTDYNLSVLKSNGLPGMEELIDRIESEARLLREAGKRLVSAKTDLDVMQSRLMATSPDLIAAINNAGAPPDLPADQQRSLDLDSL